MKARRRPADRPCRGSSSATSASRRTIRTACGSTTSRFELKGGEILGIAGVAGNGQGEFFEALSGERLAQDAGTVVIDGKDAGHLSITGAAGSARPSCRRSGSAMAPRRA